MAPAPVAPVTETLHALLSPTPPSGGAQTMSTTMHQQHTYTNDEGKGELMGGKNRS